MPVTSPGLYPLEKSPYWMIFTWLPESPMEMRFASHAASVCSPNTPVTVLMPSSI